MKNTIHGLSFYPVIYGDLVLEASLLYADDLRIYYHLPISDLDLTLTIICSDIDALHHRSKLDVSKTKGTFIVYS